MKPRTLPVEQLRALQGASGSKRNKYGAKKPGSNASRKEHDRAARLRLLQKAGLISDLREQVSFTVIPTQRAADGKLIEKCTRYVADFVYRDKEGNTVVEDTKGFRTPEYIMKRKLMLHLYGIRIKET